MSRSHEYTKTRQSMPISHFEHSKILGWAWPRPHLSTKMWSPCRCAVEHWIPWPQCRRVAVLLGPQHPRAAPAVRPRPATICRAQSRARRAQRPPPTAAPPAPAQGQGSTRSLPCLPTLLRPAPVRGREGFRVRPPPVAPAVLPCLPPPCC